MRAAIYARFSTDRQNESSITDQFRVCTEFTEREGMHVSERFDDQGISGAALGNRPGVIRMQEAALARRFDVLLVTDLSRLSRSNGDLSKMIDRLVAKGLRVVGVQDGYDSSRRGHKLQAGLSGIIGEAFREMVKDRTYAALESRAKERRPTGGRAYGYTALAGTRAVDVEQAEIVRQIFTRFAEGGTYRAIAAELNAKAIPSPGSTWARKTRRRAGWMGSAVRAILKNEIYRGAVHWNTSAWVKDPDSGKRQRRARPKSEWISHTDEALRIVSDELWQRSQRRTRLQNDERIKAGGKAKYLLSGLLSCADCGAHFILVNSREYGCSSHINGGACPNSVRIGRGVAEKVILGPVNDEMLAPANIARMAKKLQRAYAAHMDAQASRFAVAPQELQALDARLARLRARLQAGDPDMTGDEIQAAIDRAQAKREELVKAQPSAKLSAKVLTLLPRAAAECRKIINQGLGGNPRAAEKARHTLRQLFGGKIRMVNAKDGSLWAEAGIRPAELLRGGFGTDGSGGRI